LLFAIFPLSNCGQYPEQRAESPGLYFLVDETRSLDCDSVLSESDWQPVGAVLNQGFTDSAIWIKVQGEPGLPGARFIMFRQAMIGEAMQCGPAGIRKAGVTVPVHKWPLNVRYPTFRLPPGEGPFYFRVVSRKVVNFPVELYGMPELLNHIQVRQIIQFTLLAGAGITALFFAAIYLYSFRTLYLLFSLALFCVTGSLFITYGDGYLYLWPGSPAVQNAMFKFTSMVAAMFSSLFVRSLLQTWQWKWLDRIILAAIGFQALAAFSSLWPSLDPFFFVVLVSGPFVGVLITVPVAFIRLKEGDVPARFYFLGWIALLAAFFFNILVFRGVLDYEAWMAHAPIFAAPITFLFLGLGSYSRMQSEKRKRYLLQEKNRLLMEQLEGARSAVLHRKEGDRSSQIVSSAYPVSSKTKTKTRTKAETSSGSNSSSDSNSSNSTEGPGGSGRSQLAGVDLEAKKALLLKSMKEDKLYEVEDLRLEALARHVDLRPHQLSELLNQILNTSFSDFLRKFRIDAAMAKLADPSCPDSILDIGLAVGFGSKTAFNRSFASITGMTPGQFRSQAKRDRLAERAS
tara:strand:- start:61270 stop:62985 length:1716 start_codon:yes stop_codon:yes gene_type:complete